MNVLLLAVVVLICFVLCLFVPLTIYIHIQHRRYAHIPGPPNEGITGFYLGIVPYIKAQKNAGSFFSEMFYDWQMKYGNVLVTFLLHRPLILTADQAAIKDLLVTGGHPKAKFAYEDLFNLFGQRFLGHGLVTELDHDKWSKRRLLMNPAFNRGYLKSLMPIFNATADAVTEELSKIADGKTMVKMLTYMNRTTLDVIGKVAFDMDIDSIHDTSNPFPDAIFTALQGFSYAINDPIGAKLPWVEREFKERVRESVRLLRKTGYELIQKREVKISRGETVPEDILTHVCRCKANEPGFDIEAALDDFVTFFGAGQETTANTMAFVLMECGRRPDVMNKLKSEVDALIGDKKTISYEDIMSLEYANMVLKETLRLYPTAGQTFRTVTKDNYDIGGYAVPNGTDVVVSTYVVSRLPCYHKDPLTFDPERFHPNSDRRPSMYTYFPFAIGPRSCIGQTFAQIEAKLLLAKFVQKFNIHLDMTQSFGILETGTMKPKDGCRCTLTLRDK